MRSTKRRAARAVSDSECGDDESTSPCDHPNSEGVPNCGEWDTTAGGTGEVYQAVVDHAGLSWEEANEKAESLGGKLATPATEEEDLFLREGLGAGESGSDPGGFTSEDGGLIFAVPTGESQRGPWLGATFQTSGWTWIDGKPWAYQNWQSGSAPSADEVAQGFDRLAYALGDNPGWVALPTSPLAPQRTKRTRSWVRGGL